jgi:hypothetical protein
VATRPVDTYVFRIAMIRRGSIALITTALRSRHGVLAIEVDDVRDAGHLSSYSRVVCAFRFTVG